MTEAVNAQAEEPAELPADDGAEPIVIRKLDRRETTSYSNPNGA